MLDDWRDEQLSRAREWREEIRQMRRDQLTGRCQYLWQHQHDLARRLWSDTAEQTDTRWSK